MSQYLYLLWVLPFLMGWVVGWIQGTEPLKRKVKDLESVLSLDSVQKMERILVLEQELRWSQAKVQAQESDLARMNQKLTVGGMDLPQARGTYWKMEMEKAQKKVLELELELESLRSKTLWKE
jgi:hypothetical protein